MDPFTTLSLISSLITLTDFGVKTASLCKTAYRMKQPFPELADAGRSFDVALTSFKEKLRPQSKSETSNKAEGELLALCQKSQNSADKLLAELSKLNVRVDGGSWRQTVGGSIKAVWRINKVGQLHNELTTYQRALNMRILADLRSVLTFTTQLCLFATLSDFQ